MNRIPAPSAESPECDFWWSIDLARIDQERILRGWTRGELARRAAVDPGTLSGMFRRRRRPVLGTVQAIACVLGLTLAEIIEFDSYGRVRQPDLKVDSVSRLKR